MIHILVITDRNSSWTDKFALSMNIVSGKYSRYESHLENEMFIVDIVANIHPCCGKRYNIIILDKLIDKELEDRVVRPSTRDIIKTDNYYKELVKECENRK